MLKGDPAKLSRNNQVITSLITPLWEVTTDFDTLVIVLCDCRQIFLLLTFKIVAICPTFTTIFTIKNGLCGFKVSNIILVLIVGSFSFGECFYNKAIRYYITAIKQEKFLVIYEWTRVRKNSILIVHVIDINYACIEHKFYI